MMSCLLEIYVGDFDKCCGMFRTFADSLGAPANVKELTVVLCCILFFQNVQR